MYPVNGDSYGLSVVDVPKEISVNENMFVAIWETGVYPTLRVSPFR
jgi:hypothetical protein